MRKLFLFCCLALAAVCLFAVTPSVAQPDSVIVSGRIDHLTARLYRESPQVLISRNNILQASRELVRPAPLNADGTFRVSVPLIYSQEELYFNYGRISTAFLAAPGTITITLDADSLFTAAVPFRFTGTNAQVNQQYARYKAFEAGYADKPDARKLSRQVTGMSDTRAYTALFDAYNAPFRAFAGKEKPFPLLTRWVTATSRYNAVSFLYDKAAFEGGTVALADSLRPLSDPLLTAARAAATNRFSEYVVQQASTPVSGRNNGLSVRTLATLLEQYGRNLSENDRERLEEYKIKNSAKASDLRFFDTLLRRNADTLTRLVNYEALLQRGRQAFDSTSMEYVAAYWLAQALPGLTLNYVDLLYNYMRPKLNDPQLVESLSELYQLQVKDSARIRSAVRTLAKTGSTAQSLEISPGVFVTQNAGADGFNLLNQVVNANRGKVIYVLMTSPTTDAGRQAAIDAQRLRNQYRAREFALVYVPMPNTEKTLWPEISTRYNLAGDHVLATEGQFSDIIEQLRPVEEISATVINRTGKIAKRNAPLPDASEELEKILDKSF
ncbi:hypothetical protein DYU11_27825 [Fibrisoma montanum]|uniref:Thioredoxin domain-containing protein n=1 Tax=Fibrisoma montanum TaxID=2305895 RepID=A0A418LZP9_9BACT|nr:hypothetical protein [Fibrisoma montanum]RIV18772.1 hypothetical protein DYU11_27825 [Fibrisoma montanum]